jgi:hypothetical protein
MTQPALIYMVIRQMRGPGPFRRKVAFMLGVGIALLASGCAPDVPDYSQRIQVYLSAPVADASVYLWWVDHDGRPLRKDGTRHASPLLLHGTAVASGVTDETGAVVLDDVDFVYGNFVLMAQGGGYVDSWLVAEGISPEDAWRPLDESLVDAALWSVVVDYVPSGTDPEPLVISPLTTLAKAVADRRLSFISGDASGEAPWYASMRDAYALLGAHLGTTNLTRGPLPDWMPGMPEPTEDVPADDESSQALLRSRRPVLPGSGSDATLLALDEQAYRGLILAAFPSLAWQMARAAGLPAGNFDARDLLALLRDDIQDDVGLLDGIGPAGRLVVGGCELPDECAGEADAGAVCRTPCALDSNTLRADLATALAFDFLGSPLDRSGLTLDDVRPLVEQLRTGQTSSIFGHDVPVLELGGPRPIVRALPTTVFDELHDAIVFDERSVPVHTASDYLVELGAFTADEAACPTLHKFVHRLDDPGDNAIRWQFEVADQRGAAIESDAGMYRLRQRQPVPGEPGKDIGPWLTDWLPARALSSVVDGVEYEVVLLRSQIPVLGLVSGEIEIEFRGADQFGLESEPVRYCWQHVPLAAPLQVRNVVEATGAGSLHEANLEPGNNLAPLLNGVPLEQGRSVMDVEIVNGTAEVVYATFAIEQGLTTFTKSWQKTNVHLFFAGESDCLENGDCTMGFLPDRRSIIATDEAGTIERLVSGVTVLDEVTAEYITPCEECNVGQYRIEPRIALGNPRVYRVRLVVTDLGALAPQPLGEELGPFTDAPIDAEIVPIPITGRPFERVKSCQLAMTSLRCEQEEVYRHYVSLVDVALTLAGVRLAGRTSPWPDVPVAIMLPAQDGVLGAPAGIETYHWHTTEVPLPPPHP